jgi:hypothetical protein
MGLLYWIKQGFGWGIGHELARDAYAEAKRAVSESAHDGDEAEVAAGRAARAKAATKAAKARAAEERRREREVERELRAMKKRLRDGGR